MLTRDDKTLFHTILGATLAFPPKEDMSVKEILVIAGHTFEDIKSAAKGSQPNDCSGDLWDLIQTAILGS